MTHFPLAAEIGDCHATASVEPHLVLPLMLTPPLASSVLLDHLAILPDPRIKRQPRHKLIDIVAMTICGVLGGADTWVDIALFGQSKEAWFRRFLELPHGIPSHDTFGRVFARLDPNAFEAVFRDWIRSVQQTIAGVVAIDGKTLRGSHQRSQGQAPIHLVSAWASANRVVLGQVQTDSKSNEITAIPELLAALSLKGCIVTMDAMGCQTALAEQIREQQGDYVLTLKANHSNLHYEVRCLFEICRDNDFAHRTYRYHETLDKDHGREEIRRHWVIEVPDYLRPDTQGWRDLSALGLVERERRIGDKVSIERRHYLLSFHASGQQFAETVRAHWGIENRLHWMIDVAFNEDASRVRRDHGPANLARVRRIAQTLLQQDITTKASMRSKRNMAGWNTDYLEFLMTRDFSDNTSASPVKEN